MSETTFAPETSTELIAVEEIGEGDANDVMELVKNFGKGNPHMTTSVVVNSDEGALTLFGALSDPEKIDEHTGEEIKLVDYVVQHVEMPVQDSSGQPTGELVSVPRVTMIDADGVAYVGTSKPLADALDMLVFLANRGKPGSWNAEGKHLSVMVKRVKTSTPGRTTFRLTPYKVAAKK